MTSITSIGIAGIIAFASFGLLSLTGNSQQTGNPQKTELSKGDTGTQFDLESFDKIELAGSCDVELVQGTSNSIEILSTESEFTKDLFDVRNGKLTINLTPNGKGKQISIKVTVAGPLKELSLTGSGSLTLTDAFNGLEKITLSGSGDISSKQESTTKNIYITIMGSGDIDFLSTNCEEAHCSIMGSGDIKVGISQSIHAEITGSGNIYYKGEPGNSSEYINIGSGKIVSI